MAKQTDLLSVEEARSRILARFHRLPSENVALDEAADRVLAADIVAPINVPPFANSSMDGFALRSADTPVQPSATSRLEIRGQIAAGSVETTAVESGSCARIMTGAPVPPGADAVVPFEDVQEIDGFIVLSSPILAGSCIRPSGNDMRAGQHVLEAGTEMGPPQIALAASLGFASVPVTRRPVVAVLSTGDELVLPGTVLQQGQIYNSNTPMIAAALRAAGATPRLLDTASDDPEVLRGGILAAEGCDLLLTTGGASVGAYDYVKDIVSEEGELQFWRVRVRPGKPLLLGSIRGLSVIGLPGNPTSAMVTFEEFVRPTVRRMLGAPTGHVEVCAVVDERIENSGGRRTYARVVLETREGRFHARLAGPQDSAMLLSLARADGLLEIPEELSELLPGQEARVQVWRLPRA